MKYYDCTLSVILIAMEYSNSRIDGQKQYNTDFLVG